MVRLAPQPVLSLRLERRTGDPSAPTLGSVPVTTTEEQSDDTSTSAARITCLLLTPLFPPWSLPTQLLPADGGTRGPEASPDNDINVPRTSAPSTLRPKPVGFVMWW